jgi:hypothetical protein
LIGIPMELVYLLIAIGVGVLLFRYFTGHDGIRVSEGDYATLPAVGELVVGQLEVRWQVQGGGFVAGWSADSGLPTVMQVTFPEPGQESEYPQRPEFGRLDVHVGRRQMVRGVAWTDGIRDRALRADAEAVLAALQEESRRAGSDPERLAHATRVGDEGESAPTRPGSDGGAPD